MLVISTALLLAIGALMQVQVQVLASWMLQTYTGEKLVHDFRARLFWRVQRPRLEFHDRTGTNDTAYRIQHDAPAIQIVSGDVRSCLRGPATREKQVVLQGLN